MEGFSMESSTNYYNPKAWKTCRIVKIDQLALCPVKTI